MCIIIVRRQQTQCSEKEIEADELGAPETVRVSHIRNTELNKSRAVFPLHIRGHANDIIIVSITHLVVW